MAEQDFLAKLGKIAGKGLSTTGKQVGRKSMPKISITIDEEFRLPAEFGGQQLEDEEDDFLFPDMARKKDLAKIRAQRLAKQKKKMGRIQKERD